MAHLGFNYCDKNFTFVAKAKKLHLLFGYKFFQMKTRVYYFAFLLIISTTSGLKAQWVKNNFYGEIGGTAFFGLSANVQSALYFGESSSYFAALKMGLGHTLPRWDGNSILYNVGFELGKGRKHAFALGADLAKYNGSPIARMVDRYYYGTDFDMMFYPRLSYSLRSSGGTFYRFTGGVLGPVEFGRWEDPVPFFSIGIGF